MATPFTSEGIPTYMLETPDAQMPNPQDAATLPMFNPSQGYDGTNAQNEGDLGGAK